MKNFKPTYLYIKRNTVTGLLYLGKTSSSNPLKYKGSGLYWKNHNKVHGWENVETLWYCLFLDKRTIEEFALMISSIYSVDISEEWANLTIENGLDGGDTGHKHNYKGTVAVRDKNNNTMRVSIDHPDYISGVLVPVNKGIKYKTESEIRTCPHCGKVGKGSAMTQWHFDNCGINRKHKSGKKKTCLVCNKTLSAGVIDKKHNENCGKVFSKEIICPHCGKTSKGLNNMKRFHFDNCKHKK